MKQYIRRLATFALGVMLSSPLCFSGSAALAGECLQYLPAAATAVGELQLCEATLNDETETFSCQKYQDDDRTYAVLFKGGRSPYAIYYERHDGPRGQTHLMWSRQKSDGLPACELATPAGVPAEARFMGTGVCVDDTDELVPCAMFEHSAARCSKIRRYLVFYDRTGGGPVRITLGASNSRNFQANSNDHLCWAPIGPASMATVRSESSPGSPVST